MSETSMLIEWDMKSNGEYAQLEAFYDYDKEMNTLAVYSVMYHGLDWIDYISDITRNYITNYISERLDDSE
jgi:hypothetical protein